MVAALSHTLARRLARAGTLLLLAGCGASQTPLVRPEFAPPRAGVFNEPLPVVETTNDDLMPALSQPNGLIAYASKEAGNLDIFVRPFSGGAAARLTTHSADDTSPVFSPDGQLIAWTSQVDDVKGDIWIMAPDGDDKRQLTGRDTTDSAPAWSPSGRTIYFTSRPRDGEDRIDAIDIERGERRTIVAEGRDPAVSPDGGVLFYIARGEHGRPRLFALRLADGRVAALTDGAYAEALPVVASFAQRTAVVFSRFVDDQTNDDVADADDPASLWVVDFDPTLFDGAVPAMPRPLTAGEGGELFVSAARDWLVFTVAGYGDLEIYALPADGIISAGAGPRAVLESARAEDNPALRRLALRYVVATSPELAGPARYELARELAERGKLNNAIEELQRAAEVLGADPLQAVSRLEIERLEILKRLEGRWLAREEAERRFVNERSRRIEAIAAEAGDAPLVQARRTTLRAEIDLALGQRARAVNHLEDLIKRIELPSEDGARALDHLAEVYGRLGDRTAVTRVCEALLRRFAAERYYAGRCAERWVESAEGAVGLSSMAALENIVREQRDLPTVAARAAAALARRQAAAGQHAIAAQSWRRIVEDYPNERAVRAEALLTLGETAEKASDRTQALEAYEQILATFLDDAALRSRARQGLTRIALLKARDEERAGQLEEARASYARLLQSNREIAIAHRRYIALSARFGRLEEVLTAYETEARANPRDRFARYGYGYALTFRAPVPLAKAQQELEAALDLDPRFGAAHLALGWVRFQRERFEPGREWMDRAAQSFQTALELLDPVNDGAMWSAAQLNLGNALFELGKTDDAFLAYLARETHGAAFEDPLTEVLFRESFARVALREDYLDVALDMAKQAYRLADRLPGAPRKGSAAAMQAAIHLLAGMPAEALDWYGRAEAVYRERQDWARVAPMLRGMALAQRALGKDGEALATVSKIITLLAQELGPREPEMSVFGAEVPADFKNVTRTPFGFFVSRQEEELAYAQSTRTLLGHGDLSRARRFDAQRLALLREAAAGKRGEHIQLELVYALNESALLAVRAGALGEGLDAWREAIGIADQRGYDPELATMLESLGALRARLDETARHPVFGEAAELVKRRLAAGGQAPGLARLARWHALDRLYVALHPAPTQPGTGVAATLERLDAAIQALDEAVQSAEAAEDPELLAHLRGFTGAAQATDDTGEEAAAPTPPATTVAPAAWRVAFDSALASHGPRGLHAAEIIDPIIAAFEADPQPRWVPERDGFLAVATASLVERGALERAWLLLERARLQELQPQPRRVGRASLADAWRRLRTSRSDPAAYAAQLKAAPSLVRALEAQPASLTELRGALAGAVLVQVFAPTPRTWRWFVIDGTRLEHVSTPPQADDLVPESVAALIDGGAKSDARPLLYIDAGELLTTPAAALRLGDGELGARFDAAEILSATYLVAARDARSLARDGVAILGGDDDESAATGLAASSLDSARASNVGSGRELVHLAVPGRSESSPALPAGHTQVVFDGGDPSVPALGFDLDALAAATLRSTVALADGVDSSPRVLRAVAQALLLAGVPSAVVGRTEDATALRRRLSAELETERVASALAAAQRQNAATPTLRLIGYAGMTFAERVDFAFTELLRLAKGAAQSYQRAQASQSVELWQQANELFEDLIDVIGFLLQPESVALLQKSPRPGAAALAGALPTRELQMRQQLAQTFLALGRIDEASTIQETLVEAYEKSGKADTALEQIVTLAKTLMAGERNQDAVRVLQRCIDLATARKQTLIEADCRSRLGSVKRASFDYAGARQEYLQALMLYTKANNENQIYPRRYLGFLYENALNDYDKALEQYDAVLVGARRYELARVVPSVLLDTARVYRLRGDFERALEQVRSAEAALKPEFATEQTDAALEAAKIYWYRGNYRRAFARQQAALELARKSGNTFQEIQAVSLEGLIAMNQGELTRAERSISAALDLARGTNRRSEEAIQLNNLGIVLQRAGKLDEAITKFREALRIDTELDSVEGRAFDLRALAVALQRQEKLDEALAALDEALELSRKIGSRYNELQCLFARGELFETRSDAAEAATSFDDAARLAVAIAVPEVEWRSLYALGRLAEARGERDEARRLLDRAIDVAERLGRGRDEATKGRSRDDLYADAVRLAIAAKDLGAAFTLSERMRGRALLDVVATRTLELPNPRAKELVEQELRTREAKLVLARETEGTHAQAQAQLEQAERAHAAALAELRRAFPDLARAFTIAPPTLEAARASLPEGVTAVSYFVAENEAHALVVRREGVVPVELPAGRAELEPVVGELRRRFRAFAPVEDLTSRLATLLLEPLAAALDGTKTLVVLPHRVLYHVPFAALPVGGAPALDRWAIATAPSFAALHDHLLRPKRPTPNRVLALASGDDLPFARLEALAVGNEVLLGPQATEARVRAARADALALAVHAELDATDPLASALLLGRGPDDDGRLELREVFALEKLAPLVTLSACHSAGGDASGDEWLGLANAFFAAGARTVVAAQDRVSDLAAGVLMKRFYRDVRHHGAAEALQRAAQWTRRYYPHPAHWSSFVLVGDFR